MRKLPLAAALAASILAAPAGASIVVIGSSVGFGCYEAARQQNGSSSAIESCDGALKSGQMDRHDTVATFVNRGIVRVYQRDFQAAVADFDRAIALDPSEAESYLNKGSTILRMSGDPKQAIALMDEALARNTRRPELAYFSRAIAHEVAGNLQEAYRDYKRAQAAAPNWEEPGRELSRFQVRPASASF